MNVLEKLGYHVEPLDQEAMAKARERLAQLTVPLGSLGMLGDLAERISGITGEMPPSLGRKAMVVMAGDHGVCEEGVSAYPSEVTQQMVLNFLQGGAAVNVFAKHAGAEVVCVDMGVAADLSHPELIVRKIGYGTRNIARGPAMTMEEAEKAVAAGIEIVGKLVSEGVRMIGIGEMGIGNTTPAAAIACVLTGASPEETVGRGTGINEEGLIRKRMVVQQAIDVNAPNPQNGMDVLAKIGGYEIAGMVGLCLGSAIYRVPLVIDGFISTAAALIASRIEPTAASYWIASHRSEEIGHQIVLESLGLRSMLSLNMRVGEGTGAALCMKIIEAGADVLGSMATFESANVSNKMDK